MLDQLSGFRNHEEPSKIVISKAFQSREHPINVAGCCGHSVLCKDTHRLMDNQVVEEQQPLPLPVEREHRQREYLQTHFEERQCAKKRRLLIEGSIKTINKSERNQGVPIMIPTSEGMDDWIAQSQSLGARIKAVRALQDQEKVAQQRKPQRNTRLTQNQSKTVSTNFHHEAVIKAFSLDAILKPNYKKVPQVTQSLKVEIIPSKSVACEKDKKNKESKSPKGGKQRKESLNENFTNQKPLLNLHQDVKPNEEALQYLKMAHPDRFVSGNQPAKRLFQGDQKQSNKVNDALQQASQALKKKLSRREQTQVELSAAFNEHMTRKQISSAPVDQEMRSKLEKHGEDQKYASLTRHTAWQKILQLQDDLKRQEMAADKDLQVAYTSLNPRFQLQKKPQLASHLNDEYLPLSFQSKPRINLIENLQMNHRTLQNIEDVSILAYVRRNGLEKPENKFNPAQTLKDFQDQASVHPTLQSLPTEPRTPFQRQMTAAKLESAVNLVPALSLTEEIPQTPQHQSTVKPTAHYCYQQADYWYQKGVVLNQKQQTTSALECYLQALKLDKNHLPSIFNLACNYQQLGQLELSKEQFQHAVAVNEVWIEALYGLALVCIKLKQPLEAIEHLKKALQISSDSQQVKYLLALAYRNAELIENSWAIYKQILPTEHQIAQNKHQVDLQNKRIAESTSITGDDSSIHYKVDFYSHMQSLGLVDTQYHFVDLWQYYDPYQGWTFDKVNEVISQLHKIRFFNRFPIETILLLIKRVTMKRLNKGEVLYLNKDEAAIVITGKLHMMCYQVDLVCPYVSRLYHPGDIVGLASIDEGWSTAEHSWIFANETVDILLCSTTYLSFLWDQMKQFKQNLVAQLIMKSPCFCKITEQTLYTLAYDVATFKEYTYGETILGQDHDSPYNLVHLQQEFQAVQQFATKQDVSGLQKVINPSLKQIWQTQEAKNQFDQKRLQIREQRRQMVKQGLIGSKPHKNDDDSSSDHCQSLVSARKEAKRQLEIQLGSAEIQNLDKISNTYKKEAKFATQVLESACNILTQYKESRQAITKDTDGIYILVKGAVKVVNRADQQELASLDLYQCFGESKFTVEPSFSYFGDLIANAKDEATEPQANVQGRESQSSSPQSLQGQNGRQNMRNMSKVLLSSQKAALSTTCMFLPAELLFLVPFYDLAKIKEIKQKMASNVQLRKTCYLKYKEKRRKLRKQFQ